MTNPINGRSSPNNAEACSFRNEENVVELERYRAVPDPFL